MTLREFPSYSVSLAAATAPTVAHQRLHVELRRAWNAEEDDKFLKTFGLDDLRAAVANDLPVFVWATQAYAELVWLWWILDGLERIGPRASPAFLVRPDGPARDRSRSSAEEG
jgi:hypothetical protein